MANIPLKSIKFPDLPDTYVIEPEITDVQGLEDALNNKANIDGSYDDMTVGNAKQLLSDMYVEDKEPFTFRTTGGSNNIGDRADMELVGWTGVWNQLADVLPNATRNGLVYSTNNDRISVSGTVQGAPVYGQFALTRNFTLLRDGRKYLVTLSQPLNVGIAGYSYRVRDAFIFSISNSTPWEGYIYLYVEENDVVNISNLAINIVDLTAFLGSTIADYIYTLETNQAGDGVAFYKKYFANPYYTACQPKLESVCVSAYANNGFNQFDKDTIKTSEGAYILNDNGEKVADGSSSYFAEATKVMPNTAYYLLVNGDNVDGLQKLYYFDANDNFISRTGYVSSGVYTTPSNCHYIRYQYKVATVDTSKWCINLHWDGERDGQYEAYDQRNYPLDTVTLRGILKLDANNVPYADGDTYSADGTVIRRYGTRAYQAGDESLADAITDGTNTVYKLTTPTTESADPYTTPQIVEDWGTEWYTDYEVAQGNRDVAIPVGHNTKYLENLKADVEMMPKSPNGDGDYVMRQTSGQNAYVSLASTPTITDIINRLEALENA